MNNQHMYLLGPESIEPLIGHSILGNNVKVESSRSFGDPGRSSARRWASSGYRRSITNRFELRKDHRRPQLCASRSEEHTSELQSHHDLVCRLLLEKKKNKRPID